MIVFTRKYPIQTMLKKRKFKFNKIPQLRFGTIGIYCLYTFRFEYRYCLFLRKFFKKLFKRKKRKIRTFLKKKTWLFIRPNYALTHKSKNARMGKGKGNFKRWCTIVYPGKIFIEHVNVSPKTYLKYISKIKIKLKLQLKYIYIANIFIKKSFATNTTTQSYGLFDIVKIRKNLYMTQKKFNSLI
jgi:ribosomal protein L16/L10AE